MSRQAGTGRSSRLPRGLRGLAHLATLGPRVENITTNLGTIRSRLDNYTKKLGTLDKQVEALSKRVQQQNERLATTSQQQNESLTTTLQQQNESLTTTLQELETLRARLEKIEAGLRKSATSRAPVGKKNLPDEEVRAAISKVEHWYHRIEVAPGIVTPGTNDSHAVLQTMEIPERLEGKRVLDVGARDGYFSFMAEDRGAEVLAIDAVAPDFTGFYTAARFMESSVEYRTMNVYDVSPEEVGTFDIIFFLGVLYHLRDPMLALDRLWSVANPGATIWVESHTIDRRFLDPQTKDFEPLSALAPELAGVAVAQFYPEDLLLGDGSNWWGPNLACLEAMVAAAGFEVLRSHVTGGRGMVVARKTEDEQISFFRDFDRSVVTEQPNPAV